jgi:hypothetical protein
MEVKEAVQKAKDYVAELFESVFHGRGTEVSALFLAASCRDHIRFSKSTTGMAAYYQLKIVP